MRKEPSTTIGTTCGTGVQQSLRRSHGIIRKSATSPTGWERLTISHDCDPETEHEPRWCEGFISSIEPYEETPTDRPR